MANENKPDDFENTVRLDAKKIMDPYADPTPSSSNSIDDILNPEDIIGSNDLTSIPDITYSVPEETFVSPEANFDFNDLNKEIEELSNQFDDSIQTKASPEIDAIASEPVMEKETAPKVDTVTPKPIVKKEAAPKVDTVIPKPVVKKEAAPKVDTVTPKPVVKKEAAPKVDTAIPKPVVEKKSTPEVDAITAKPAVEKKSIPELDAITPEPIVKKSTPQKTNTAEINKSATEASSSTKEQAKTTSNTEKTSSGNGSAIFMALIALVAGGFGVWTSMSSQAQIDSLSTQLNTMQNNYLSNQSELVTIQKELSTLKKESIRLQDNAKAPTLPDNKNAIVKPVQSILPVAITPRTPIKEVQPVSLKNTWSVIVSSHDSMKKAKNEQQREAMKGMKTSIVAVVVKGKNWYRIVATGFAEKQQAVAFTHKLKQQGISDAWIRYNK